jgi:hypothetical protein
MQTFRSEAFLVDVRVFWSERAVRDRGDERRVARRHHRLRPGKEDVLRALRNRPERVVAELRRRRDLLDVQRRLNAVLLLYKNEALKHYFVVVSVSYVWILRARRRAVLSDDVLELGSRQVHVLLPGDEVGGVEALAERRKDRLRRLLRRDGLVLHTVVRPQQLRRNAARHLTLVLVRRDEHRHLTRAVVRQVLNVRRLSKLFSSLNITVVVVVVVVVVLLTSRPETISTCGNSSAGISYLAFGRRITMSAFSL